jgi:hypothetical protein
MTAKSPKFGKVDQQLDEILGRVKYIGPEPPPSEDETMDMAVDEVCAVRGKGRLEERPPRRNWRG